MTVAVTVLSVVVAVLAVLVVGLLRSHAAILRGLDRGELGAPRDGELPLVEPGLPTPRHEAPSDGRQASDIVGETPDGSAVAVRVTGTAHDTVLAFLSSSCATCETFWREFRAGVELPERTRLVVVTKGPEHESPAEVAALAPDGIPLVMSSQAWEDHDIPGSPYVVHVDGPSGRARGEGTGGSWRQVSQLLAQATGDLAFVEPGAPRSRKARTDTERERDTDRALLAAGIHPGDPSLYQRFDGTETVE